jgi:hypothetical protein
MRAGEEASHRNEVQNGVDLLQRLEYRNFDAVRLEVRIQQRAAFATTD